MVGRGLKENRNDTQESRTRSGTLVENAHHLVLFYLPIRRGG